MTDEIFRPKEIATLHRIAALSDDELTALFDFARERAASIRAAREAAASAATQKAAAEKGRRDGVVIHQAVQPALGTDADLSDYVQLVGTRLLDAARQESVRSSR